MSEPTESLQEQIAALIHEQADHPYDVFVYPAATCPGCMKLAAECVALAKRAAIHPVSEGRISALISALEFISSISQEELPFAKVGTGAEVALRHISRKAEEALDKEREYD